jgi:hypothetical protein
LINGSNIGIRLRSLRPFPAAITRWLRMPKHLPHRLSRYAKQACSFTLAQIFYMASQPYVQRKFHGILPPTFHPQKIGRLQVAGF